MDDDRAFDEFVEDQQDLRLWCPTPEMFKIYTIKYFSLFLRAKRHKLGGGVGGPTTETV